MMRSASAKFAQKQPDMTTSHDVLEPLKQALLSSRDVIISSKICGSNAQRVFTLGDGCWLPNPGVIRADMPCQNFGQGPRNLVEASISKRTSMSQGADVHDTKAFPRTSVRITENTPTETLERFLLGGIWGRAPRSTVMALLRIVGTRGI